MRARAIGTRRSLRRFVRLAGRTLHKEFVDSRVRAFALVRRIWREGRAERAALLGLVVLTLAWGWAAAPAGAGAARGLLPIAAGVSLFALAWAVALAAAAAHPHPAVLFVAGPWLLFYQAIVAPGVLRTPLAVLPALWLLWIMLRRLLGVASRARGLAAWLVVTLWFAYMMAGPSGLRGWLGWPAIDAQLLVWSVLAAAGLVAFSVARRADSDGPGFAHAFWGALAAAGVAVGVSAARRPEPTLQSVGLVFADAAGILVLFWMWAAGRVAASGVKSLEWLIRHTARLLPDGLTRPGAPVAIAAALVALRVFAAPSIDRLEIAVFQAIVWAGIAALGLVGWWAIEGRLTAGRSILVLAWWAVAYTGLTGIVSASRAAIAAHDVATPVVAAAGFLLLAAGLAVELGKLAKHWDSASPARVRGTLAMVVVAAACALALTTPRGNAWETTRTLMVLVGMIHLGLPLAIDETWGRRLAGRALETPLRVELVAAGYASGVLVIVIDPQRPWALAAAVPLLVAAVVGLRRSRPDLPRPAGILAGVLFASGVVACWMHPNPPTIPFVPWAAIPEGVPVDKPLLTAFHLVVVLGAWAVGALAGAVAFRGRARIGGAAA